MWEGEKERETEIERGKEWRNAKIKFSKSTN